jgi:ATP-binding cassette subfamily B protein
MNKEVYRHLLHTYGRNAGQWVGFVAQVFTLAINRIYLLILMAQVTANVASADFDLAKRHLLYFFLAYVAGSLAGTAGELISLHTENKQYGRLEMIYYKKLVGKDLSFYRDNQTGYLASIFKQYLDGTMLLLRFLRGEALGVFISLLVPPVVLFFAAPEIGLIAVFIVIIQCVYVTWSSSKAHKYRQLSHEVYRKVSGEVSDTITNIIAFKSAGAEDQARSRMAELITEEVKSFEFRRRTTTLLDLPRNIITACGITAAIYFIISKSSGTNPQSLGLIVLTLTYMFQIVRNIHALPELVASHDDLITKVYPTLKYLKDDYEEIRDAANPVDFIVKKGGISIDNINFSYASRTGGATKIPIFSNLTIKIKGGEQVGIVGLSGAGKSTLASLLLRFDEIDSGSIKIDGIDIRSVKQTELRKKIAYVPQEPLLFHRSVRENIAYYNSAANDAEVARAAAAAHAHEFIEKLPDGYNTIVGERGVKLSGGQKQRVVIARAILKKAPIMIFDEATSALDSESEQIIQRALPEIIGKQTAIVVAHRLSTVAGLDRIIVMHEGKVVEAGSHDELLNMKGRYYSLWQKQTSEF